MSKNILNNIIKQINIPNYTLTCPKTGRWIGMTKEQEKKHLDKFRSVFKELTEGSYKDSPRQKQIIYSRCKK